MECRGFTPPPDEGWTVVPGTYQVQSLQASPNSLDFDKTIPRFTHNFFIVLSHQDQPDPVCACGKTSEGVCPRCGQNMGRGEGPWGDGV